MSKTDDYHKEVLTEILQNGTMDENPRPHYEEQIAEGEWWCATDPITERKSVHITTRTTDGNYIRSVHLEPGQSVERRGDKCILCTPAYTKFINHVMHRYNIAGGEFPFETLRPIAWKSAVKEIIWIYIMQSNKLSDLHDMNIKYWDEWDIGDGTIGCRYGATVKRHDLLNNLLNGLIKDPFGRRHIMSLWQEDDFKDETGGTTKGLNPCCYETIWNVRRVNGELYLDMLMNQRSSDYEVSSSINEIQYVALQMMVARHCGMQPGIFTHVMENVQIYDRHLKNAETIINRKSIECSPKLILNPNKKNIFDITIDDFELFDYPIDKIKEVNPQLKFDLGI